MDLWLTFYKEGKPFKGFVSREARHAMLLREALREMGIEFQFSINKPEGRSAADEYKVK